MPSTKHKTTNHQSDADMEPGHPLPQKMLAAAAAYERRAQRPGESERKCTPVSTNPAATREVMQRQARPGHVRQPLPKMLAAREAYRRLFGSGGARRRNLARHKTEKQVAAEAVLVRRYEQQREYLRKSKDYVPLTCEAKVDRTAITVSTATEGLLDELRTIPGYQARDPQELWNQAYGSAQRIKGTGSIRELALEYRRQVGWVPPLRITIMPRDATGLLYEDLRHILELLPNYEIKLAETAVDFPINSVVDVAFVRKHCLFGKLRPSNVGRNPLWDLWGRREMKLARSYTKFEIDAHRLELQFRSTALRKLKIRDFGDLPRLTEFVAQKQIFFGRLSRTRLVAMLDKVGFTETETREILRGVAARKANLWEALRYLRATAHLTNTRRLLVPLPANEVVRQALEQLGREWRCAVASAGHRLGVPVDSGNDHQSEDR